MAKTMIFIPVSYHTIDQIVGLNQGWGDIVMHLIMLVCHLIASLSLYLVVKKLSILR